MPALLWCELFVWLLRRWAHEHKNEEAIELLQAAGVDENAKDRGVHSCVLKQPSVGPPLNLTLPLLAPLQMASLQRK